MDGVDQAEHIPDISGAVMAEPEVERPQTPGIYK